MLLCETVPLHFPILSSFLTLSFFRHGPWTTWMSCLGRQPRHGLMTLWWHRKGDGVAARPEIETKAHIVGRI